MAGSGEKSSELEQQPGLVFSDMWYFFFPGGELDRDANAIRQQQMDGIVDVGSFTRLIIID